MAFLTRLMYYTYELMQRVLFPACSRAAGKEINQITVILDLKGISLSEVMAKNVINMTNTATKCVQEYFPDIIHKTYIINTPMLFSTFFNIIKPFLNSRTQATTSMPGSKYLKELETVVPISQLPVEIGGKCKDPLNGSDYGFYVPYLQAAQNLRKWDVTPEEAGVAPTLDIKVEPAPKTEVVYTKELPKDPIHSPEAVDQEKKSQPHESISGEVRKDEDKNEENAERKFSATSENDRIDLNVKDVPEDIGQPEIDDEELARAAAEAEEAAKQLTQEMETMDNNAESG